MDAVVVEVPAALWEAAQQDLDETLVPAGAHGQEAVLEPGGGGGEGEGGGGLGLEVGAERARRDLGRRRQRRAELRVARQKAIRGLK